MPLFLYYILIELEQMYKKKENSENNIVKTLTYLCRSDILLINSINKLNAERSRYDI